MLSKKESVIAAAVLLVLVQTFWFANVMYSDPQKLISGRDDALLLNSRLELHESDSVVSIDNDIVTGREADKKLATREEKEAAMMTYYGRQEDQLVVGPPSGNIVIVHMGRSGSTFLQRAISTTMLRQFQGESVHEILEPVNVLAVMRKYLEVGRDGSLRERERLEENIGERFAAEVFALNGRYEANELFDPGDNQQFGELQHRGDEEFDALVYALRFLLAPPPGAAMTMSSLKIWAICGVGFTIEQYFEALEAAGVSDMLVVHRNYLRRLLSARAAELSGKWHSLDRENVNCGQKVFLDLERQVKCDPEKQHNMTDLFRMSDSAYASIFKGPVARRYPHALVLSYENDIYPFDGERANHKLFRHFGLGEPNSSHLGSILVKTTDCPLQEVIEDFEDVTAALISTPWRYCLEEAGQQAALGNPIDLVLGRSTGRPQPPA